MKEASYITDASNELIKQIDDTKAPLLRVKNLEAEWKEMIAAKKKKKNLANDPRVTRNIKFNTSPETAAPPTMQLFNPLYVDKSGHRIMTTPSENLVVATRILETNKSLEGVSKAHALVKKAMEQQSRSRSSQKLSTGPKICESWNIP
jgi:hypothetical protein